MPIHNLPKAMIGIGGKKKKMVQVSQEEDKGSLHQRKLENSQDQSKKEFKKINDPQYSLVNFSEDLEDIFNQELEIREKETLTLDSSNEHNNHQTIALQKSLQFDIYSQHQIRFEVPAYQELARIETRNERNQNSSFKKQSIPAEITTKVTPSQILQKSHSEISHRWIQESESGREFSRIDRDFSLLEEKQSNLTINLSRIQTESIETPQLGLESEARIKIEGITAKIQMMHNMDIHPSYTRRREVSPRDDLTLSLDLADCRQ